MKRVAVIAVHGVADQKPGETARAVARLLQGTDGGRRYAPFRAHHIQVAQSPPRLARRVTGGDGALACGQQGMAVRQARQGRPVATEFKDVDQRMAPDTAAADDDELLEFYSVIEQLQDFTPHPDETAFDTVVLEGHRRALAADTPDARVDVYELHWADLSRLRSGLLSVFFEFYLLLFFFSRVGGITLERAQVHFRRGGRVRLWNALTLVHCWAELLLTLVVPAFALCLLTLLVPGVLHFVPDGTDPRALAVLPAALGALLCGGVLYHNRRHLRPDRWPWLYPLTLAAGIGLALLWLFYVAPYKGLMAALCLVTAGLLYLVFRAYERRHPGALWVGVFTLGATGLVFGLSLFNALRPDTPLGMVEAALEAGRLLLYPNVAAWALFVAATVAVSALGWLAQGLTPPAERAVARASVWTANLSLVIPGLLVLIFNVALWRALVVYIEQAGLLPQEAMFITPSDLADGILLPGFSVGVALLAVAALGAVWAISPAAFSEMWPEQAERDGGRWLGRALSAGFRIMRWSGETLRALLVVGMPVSAWVWIEGLWPWPEVDQAVALGAGVVLAVMISARGPLGFLGLGFRAVLDVALDVANWLRMTPRTRTVRARISQRYLSLLRHVFTWRDPHDGAGYDGVVIVAHSQGTVITADLLRFLHWQWADSGLSPDLALTPLFEGRVPVAFLSMGSPLRQLYALRFPVQYRWAACHDEWQVRHGYPQKCRAHGPDPARLGVVRWSNLYTSGDYVGRYLWHTDDSEAAWSGEWSAPFEAPCAERCLGAGAHTHYFEGRFPAVGEELDRLIRQVGGV